MTGIEANRKRMVELLEALTTGEGMRPSLLDGVKLIRADRSYPRSPVLYEPSIVIVANGRKRGYVGDRVYTYDAQNYLVLTVPMPFECETEVGENGPLLGVSIRVELAVLSELMMNMNMRTRQAHGEGADRCISATPLDAKLGEATIRLLEALGSPLEAKVLGPQIVREITYRVLCGEQGGALRALLSINGAQAQIQRALHRMHSEYASPIEIASLAGEAGMSVSAFHHHFKAVTATSPLQYLKTVRLHKALMLMVQDGVGAAVAADKVGYESASQFSREFKRFFGAPPIDEAERVRSVLAFTPQEARVQVG
ncbi:MAG TPA: AraC family transcriptional regulator [Clostridia bacterium]|nr:AraC family transcriptional regulator [Clostridia bacterium]